MPRMFYVQVCEKTVVTQLYRGACRPAGGAIVACAPQHRAALRSSASEPHTCGSQSPYGRGNGAAGGDRSLGSEPIVPIARRCRRTAQLLLGGSELTPSKHQDSHVVQSQSIAGMLQERDLAEPAVWSHARPPRALVCNDQEIWIWSLETILGPSGFSVSRASSAAQVIEQVRISAPDVILLHDQLRDTAGVDLCRRLRTEGLVGPATPIVVTTTGPCRRKDRLQVLRAGGWDYCSLPLDAEELIAKLKVFLEAKLASDQASAESLIDPDTGLYDVQGILQRVRELGMAARRHARALGCATVSYEGGVTVTNSIGSADGRAQELVHRLPSVLRSVVRGSDVVGRLGKNEFVILAPETQMPGLLQLAERLVSVFESESAATSPAASIRIGCYAVEDFAAIHIEPVEMIVRSTQALRMAQLPGAPAVQSFRNE